MQQPSGNGRTVLDPFRGPTDIRLEAAGVVTRTRDTCDERRVYVDLTQRGRAMEAELRAIPDKVRTACQLTPDGLEQLRRTLDALARPVGAPEGPSTTNRKEHT